jgi:hypothetical protein
LCAAGAAATAAPAAPREIHRRARLEL